MSEESILKRILQTRFSQGVETDWDGLDRFLNHPEFPTRARDFRRELADAILNHTISPEEFEELTAIDRESQDDVDSFLREEVWEQMYENEPVRIP
ncbi:MAG: hypothetical protein QUS14_00510 [Pyrinomonadaceae bacterium]|nr:hypothetical protein [Pyrinomonadaceae bacterium]